MTHVYDDKFKELLDSLEARVDRITQQQKMDNPPRANSVDPQRSHLSVQDSRLQRENAELSVLIRNQNVMISKLKGDLESVQSRLEVCRQAPTLSTTSVLQRQLLDSMADLQKAQGQIHQFQQHILDRRKREERKKEEWHQERIQLRSKLSEIRAGVLILEHESLSPTSLGQEYFSIIAPFNKKACGANISLSEDCYVATRTRGSRQSVAMGSAPLTRSGIGWYYEVEIGETVEGWVGGLAIGMTCTIPERLTRIPDKAWRVPRTCIIGYSGSVFLDGKEHRTKWRPDTLKAGSRIGFLLSGDGSGDVRVFADGKAVVFAEGAVVWQLADAATGYYPIVDVFSATISVKLCSHAFAPPPPWNIDASHLSPVGSGASVSWSISSSFRTLPTPLTRDDASTFSA